MFGSRFGRGVEPRYRVPQLGFDLEHCMKKQLQGVSFESWSYFLRVRQTFYFTVTVRSKVHSAFSPPVHGRLYSADILVVPAFMAL